ncbi:hypothetical protein ACP275_08G207400 [Erythranthe tilingii]
MIEGQGAAAPPPLVVSRPAEVSLKRPVLIPSTVVAPPSATASTRFENSAATQSPRTQSCFIRINYFIYLFIYFKLKTYVWVSSCTFWFLQYWGFSQTTLLQYNCCSEMVENNII